MLISRHRAANADFVNLEKEPSEDPSWWISRPVHARLRKRLMDIVGAVAILILVSPVFLILALLVALDGGSILFQHRRIGAEGKRFWCLKFRTMVPDAEIRLKEYLATDSQARTEWEDSRKLKKDPRVTLLGSFLRRTCLDELPQLINVIRGEMSLVGPRPIVDAEVPRFGIRFEEYRRCRPGMTGLWQVSRRDEIDYRRRVELEALYHAHWSFRRDIIILFKTPAALIAARGAY